MTPPAPQARPPRNPARQPERTALSWLRTMLLATVVALLAGRFTALQPPAPARLVATAAVFLSWVVILLVGWRRSSAMTEPVPASMRWTAPLVTFVLLGYAALGVALVTVR
jgi:hypothetical protein